MMVAETLEAWGTFLFAKTNYLFVQADNLNLSKQMLRKLPNPGHNKNSLETASGRVYFEKKFTLLSSSRRESRLCFFPHETRIMNNSCPNPSRDQGLKSKTTMHHHHMTRLCSVYIAEFLGGIFCELKIALQIELRQ